MEKFYKDKKVLAAVLIGIIIALIFFYLTAPKSAEAADSITVSAVRDMNLDKTGIRIQGNSIDLLGGINANLTYLDSTYYRVSAGKDFALFSAPNFLTVAAINGGYQETNNGPSGFGVIPSISASYRLTKSLGANVSAEYWKGENKIRDFNGTVLSAGIKASF